MRENLPPYSGYRPRSMRLGKASSDKDKKVKRKKLGNPKQRFIYISAHGWKHQDYGMLCKKANKLNNM